MSGILDLHTERYLDNILPARDRVLRDMERYAAQHNVPIIGPACGRLLYQVARLGRVRRVFELGSAIGYSVLWLARAVGPKGVVYYTDNDPRNAERAKAYLRRAGMLRRVRILTGDALSLFKATPGRFDLIFNDVHKLEYPKVFRLARTRLKTGGLLISDNVLRHGRVAHKPRREHPDTAVMQRFNRLTYGAADFFTTIVPLRDGFGISMKVR